MLAQLNRKEKFAYSAIAGAILFAASYVGAKRMRPAPQITIKELPAPVTPASAVEQAKQIVIDVEGEVRNPGVYRFKEDARVMDALQAAGGATQDADTTKLNLAEHLRDGKQIMVPKFGEAPQPVVAQTMPTSSGKRGSKEMPPPGSIDINNATAEELMTVPGIGKSTAEKIVELRSTSGRITNLDQLRAIRSLSKSRLDAIRPVFRL